MEGYTVVTSDEEKVGQVVGEIGDNLIVEHGTVFKSRRPLPRAFATIDDEERVVRATVSKSIFEDAPKIDDDQLDEAEVARHYGLVGMGSGAETLGYGDVVPDDPATSAADDRAAAGMPAVEEERIASRQGTGDEGPPSPGLLGSRNPDNDR